MRESSRFGARWQGHPVGFRLGQAGAAHDHGSRARLIEVLTKKLDCQPKPIDASPYGPCDWLAMTTSIAIWCTVTVQRLNSARFGALPMRV